MAGQMVDGTVEGTVASLVAESERMMVVKMVVLWVAVMAEQ
jgi:hypothetical protein